MPGTAPKAMAWLRRMGGIAGPLSASGEASNGDPVQVEMLIAGVWTDITAYVMVRDDNGNIAVTRGRRDEGNQTDQATCELLLNNRDGRWSPRNPNGAYYGFIGRNQPVRVSVPDGIGGKSYRFWGEISVWPQGWEPTGTDVWTEVQASGILRRLSQGPEAENSVIRSALTDPTADSLVAYWPMEDASGSATLASALVTGSPMTYAGTPTLAGYDGFAASDPVPLTDATSFSGGVARYDDPTQTQVRFMCFIPADGLTDGKIICAIDQFDYSAGSAQFWELYYSTTSKSLTLRQCASDGTNLGAELAHTYDVRGKKMYISLEFAESGASITRAIRVLNLDSMVSYDTTDTAAATALSRVTGIQFGPASRSAVGPLGTIGLSSCAFGHLTVENTITSITALGLSLNPVGETAGRRIQRICGEEGIAFDSIGDLDSTSAMGNQGRQNPLNIMLEAEEADGGMLYENMAVLGLGYRTRAALCNQDAQLTLSYTGFNLSEVPTPVEDDRYIQNKVTVTVDGVSETYSLTDGPLSTDLPPTGVGVYGQDVTLNLESTSDALDQAAWRVHLGTVDEPRYPKISVNLAHSSFTSNPALKQAVLGLRQGDRILVQNPPSWLPPGDIDQLILGFEETITHFEHRVTFICAPASPYSVGVLDSSDARLDTDGSELAASVTSSDTSLVIKPSNNIFTRWTTSSSDTPFDVRMGGEVMRVTAIADNVSDTFTRVTANGWGTADSGQAWSNVNAANSDFSTNGTQAQHSVSSLNSSRYSLLSTVLFTDVDVQVEAATSALATGGPHYPHIVARYVNTNNMYAARLRFNTDQTVDLSIQKRASGVQTDIETVNISGTHAAATFFTIRFQVIGTTLRAKGWETGGVEPDWLLVTTDTTFPDAGPIGMRSVLDSLNSNALPVTFTYDNFRLLNPQTFTVTRSINSITKAHSAGADISLAEPTIIDL